MKIERQSSEDRKHQDIGKSVTPLQFERHIKEVSNQPNVFESHRDNSQKRSAKRSVNGETVVQSPQRETFPDITTSSIPANFSCTVAGMLLLAVDVRGKVEIHSQESPLDSSKYTLLPLLRPARDAVPSVPNFSFTFPYRPHRYLLPSRESLAKSPQADLTICLAQLHHQLCAFLLASGWQEKEVSNFMFHRMPTHVRQDNLEFIDIAWSAARGVPALQDTQLYVGSELLTLHEAGNLQGEQPLSLVVHGLNQRNDVRAILRALQSQMDTRAKVIEIWERQLRVEGRQCSRNQLQVVIEFEPIDDRSVLLASLPKHLKYNGRVYAIST